MRKNRDDIDWDQARVFLAVAREGQLLGAARKLGLDHATVTRRINALEEALGVKLIERTTTGSTLTPRGSRSWIRRRRSRRLFYRRGRHCRRGPG